MKRIVKNISAQQATPARKKNALTGQRPRLKRAAAINPAPVNGTSRSTIKALSVDTTQSDFDGRSRRHLSLHGEPLFLHGAATADRSAEAIVIRIALLTDGNNVLEMGRCFRIAVQPINQTLEHRITILCP